MTDLTKITTPFGLLDKETQNALRAHGGPYEWFNGRTKGWQEDPYPAYTFNDGSLAIRVKPQPPKPREWWAVQTLGVRINIGMWPDKADAVRAAIETKAPNEIIRVREVLE